MSSTTLSTLSTNVTIVATSTITTTTTTITTLINNQTEKSINDRYYNGTGYYIDDEIETGFNDLQTVILACFATLIPLILSLIIAFGIRILWTKYRKNTDNSKYDGILETQDINDDTLSTKPLHTHLYNSDKKSTDTHLSVINADELDICTGGGGGGDGGCGGTGSNGTRTGVSQIRTNNHSTTNGSIITMTLKNNHLIVETEERNDIEEDSRETTMKYSPSARDGVFVVEVQQGVRRSPGSGGQHTDQDLSTMSVSVSDQCALVHNPPDKYSDDETLEECDDYVETLTPSTTPILPMKQQIYTGLTQSNTSSTISIGHQTYSYTNQEGYDNGRYGYSNYCGYINDEPLQKSYVSNDKNQNDNDDDDDDVDVDDDSGDKKPKITAAIYKSLENYSRIQHIDNNNQQQNGDYSYSSSAK